MLQQWPFSGGKWQRKSSISGVIITGLVDILIHACMYILTGIYVTVMFICAYVSVINIYYY